VATLGEPVVGTAVYGPVRTVVWEDGGREAPSYPIHGDGVGETVGVGVGLIQTKVRVSLGRPASR
jgi:hypothetical protein